MTYCRIVLLKWKRQRKSLRGCPHDPNYTMTHKLYDLTLGEFTGKTKLAYN